MTEIVLDGKYYLGDLIDAVTLTDSLAEISYRGEVSLVVTEDLKKLDIHPGQGIKIRGIDPATKATVNLLDGIVWTTENRNIGGRNRLTVEVRDRTISLAKSESEYLFKDGMTATERIAKYAKDRNIITGSLSDTKEKLGKTVHRAQSIYSMIQKDLAATAKQSGDMYLTRMVGQHLNLIKLGTNSAVWRLEALEEATNHKTLEGAVTKVLVLGAEIKGDLQPIFITVDNPIKGIVTIQKIIQDSQLTSLKTVKKAGEVRAHKTSVSTAIKSAVQNSIRMSTWISPAVLLANDMAAAKSMIGGVQETETLEAPDVPTIRAGDKIVYNSESWLVTEVEHRLGTPGHMRLFLGDTDYVRRRYYERQ